MTSKPTLSQPLTLQRGQAWRNRIALAPLTNWQSQEDGSVSEDDFRWLTMRAEGGFGMTLTCASHVSLVGQGFPGQLGVWSDSHITGLGRLARGLHDRGAASCLQLQHAGRRARHSVSGLQRVAPWDDEQAGARALSTAEVEQVIQEFVSAAIRAERAGFQGVEMHAAHEYLLEAFLDPVRNRRTDRFGGSFENRVRILFEVAEGIRSATGPQFQLGIRLSPGRSNIPMSESLSLASRVLADGRFDFLDLSLWDCYRIPEEEGYADRAVIDHFTSLERGATRVGVTGKILDAATASRCLRSGADFVLIGRGAMLHHDFARRALGDPAFRSVTIPVAHDYLASQGLGPAFLRYIASTWPDFMTAQ